MPEDYFDDRGRLAHSRMSAEERFASDAPDARMAAAAGEGMGGGGVIAYVVVMASFLVVLHKVTAFVPLWILCPAAVALGVYAARRFEKAMTGGIPIHPGMPLKAVIFLWALRWLAFLVVAGPLLVSFFNFDIGSRTIVILTLLPAILAIAATIAMAIFRLASTALKVVLILAISLVLAWLLSGLLGTGHKTPGDTIGRYPQAPHAVRH